MNTAAKPTTRIGIGALVVALLFGEAACGSSAHSGAAPVTSTRGTTVTLLTHDAFAVSKSVLAAFTADTGIKVKVLRQGDAGLMVNTAITSRDDPQADAIYGVDNTFLSRALDHKLFDARSFRGLDALQPEARAAFSAAARYVVPVDFGDVCFNYDIAWFAKHKISPPSTIGDLTKPALRGLTVVENAATSSPGLAMVLSTIARDGVDKAMEYWRALVGNGVKIDDDWTSAYETDFTDGGGNGTRPIVLSYASSPPADIVYSEGKKTTSDVGVLTDGCFRQYEFAGVLHGASHPDAAQQLVEFLISRRFQEDMPLQMFVFPTRTDAALPEVFRRWAKVPAAPLLPDYRTIGAHRDEWIKRWTSIALG